MNAANNQVPAYMGNNAPALNEEFEEEAPVNQGAANGSAANGSAGGRRRKNRKSRKNRKASRKNRKGSRKNRKVNRKKSRKSCRS